MSEFRHRGDEEKLTTLNELKPFGLNQAINHLKVEKAIPARSLTPFSALTTHTQLFQQEFNHEFAKCSKSDPRHYP